MEFDNAKESETLNKTSNSTNNFDNQSISIIEKTDKKKNSFFDFSNKNILEDQEFLLHDNKKEPEIKMNQSQNRVNSIKQNPLEIKGFPSFNFFSKEKDNKFNTFNNQILNESINVNEISKISDNNGKINESFDAKSKKLDISIVNKIESVINIEKNNNNKLTSEDNNLKNNKLKNDVNQSTPINNSKPAKKNNTNPEKNSLNKPSNANANKKPSTKDSDKKKSETSQIKTKTDNTDTKKNNTNKKINNITEEKPKESKITQIPKKNDPINSFTFERPEYSTNKIIPSATPKKETRQELSLQKFPTVKKVIHNKSSSLPKDLEETLAKKMKLKILKKINESKNEMTSDRDFMTRVKEGLETKKKKIEDLVESNKKKEIAELKNPEINQNSKKMAERDTTSFITRSQKFTERVELKRKNKIEEKQKKEEEQIQEVQNKYKGKIDINEKYKSLMTWHNRKEESLKDQKQTKIDSMSKTCTFKPDIDKNSIKINYSKRGQNYNTNSDVVDRLYKDERLRRKHKNEILMNIYTPTFSPMINNRINFYDNGDFNTLNYSINNDGNRLNNSIRNESRIYNNSKRKTNTSFSVDKNENNFSTNYNNFFNTEANSNEAENFLKEKFKNVFNKFNLN